MYYKLGRGGRALWSIAVFLTWCVVTVPAMGVSINLGMDIGDSMREATRAMGVTPIFSDFFKLFAAAFGFVAVPILSTAIIAKLNKRLKGTTP